MKKVLSILLSFIITISFVTIPASAEVTDENLVLYYSFEDGSTATVGENAESYNVSFSSENSVSGKAVFMDGNSSYLKLPSSLNKSLGGDFTISTWAKFESTAWWMRIFDFGSDDKNYAFLGLSAPEDLRYALLSKNTPNELNMTAIGVINTEEWNNFTLVRKGKVMKLYINGVLHSESKAFGDNTPFDIQNSLNYIGKSQFASDPYFHGYIDEFKVFDTALSPDEVVENLSTGIKSEYAAYVIKYANLYDGIEAKTNLNLISFSNEKTSLSWSSSNPSVITDDGFVTRGVNDENVVITATVLTNSTPTSFPYTVFVPGINNTDAKITINSGAKKVDINPDMIGLFFEDINYAADGGLYAELVQNRSFEAVNAQWDANPKPIPSHSWTIDSIRYSFETQNGLNGNNPTYLRFTNPSALSSFTNSCYDGITVKKGEKLDFSAFLRASKLYNGKIMVTVFEGDRIIGRTFLDNIADTWEKYEAVITAVADASNAKITLTLLSDFEGTVDFDMISLFPQNTWMNRKNGLRNDLVQLLKDLHPGFLRFPGGCIIEGYNLSNRYSWKDTVGPVEERKENWNRWQMHTGGDGRYGYCQTYGLGFYEYFLLCEDIGAFPLPVVNVGIGCQYQTGDTSSMDDLYSIYIKDALDLIEFANGDPETNEWAALRASMGHPEPFNLEYIGIGNEQWETDRVNFFERYEAFEKEIHALYPDIKLIATSGPDASGAKYDAAWNFLDSHSDNGEENFAYAVDEHYYRTPDWFYTNLDRYDGFDRSGYKVFPGEYASRNSQTLSENNMNSALSIAAFMTSLEKNADIVALASYAPLFSREGYTQWAPDLIGFNNSSVYGSPDYYVQSMYSNNLGSYTVENTTENYTNSFTPKGRVGISTWTTSAQFYDMKITDNATGEEIPLGEAISTGSGSWYSNPNGYTQEDVNAQAPTLLFGNENMTNYTFTLKAKKLSGTEGFLLPVLWENEQNYYTCNLGGWGNSYSAIQRTENGNTTEVSVQNTRSFIETDREYEIKVEVLPHKLTVYLDGEAINFISFRQNVYSSSSFDEKTGDIIIKAVNTASVPMEVNFDITSDYINPIAHITELSTKDIWLTNSTQTPDNVAPISFTAPVSNSFNYFLPANSFSVFRIHTKDNSKVIESIEEVYIETEKHSTLTLPSTVTVNYLDGSTGEEAVLWDNIPWEFTESANTKRVEGKVIHSNLFAYANVKIVETDHAVLYEPDIFFDDTFATFRIAFSDGVTTDFSLKAIVASYSEDNILQRVVTHPLTQETPEAKIELAPFMSESKVKLFLMNNFNHVTDSITIK